MAVTGTVTRGFTFSDTTPITPSNLNSLGTPTVEIAGAVGTLSLDDGSITNAKVSATAAIDYSKLAALTGGNLLVGNGSNVATSVTMSGDCTMDNAGAVSIGEDKVTLAMIAAGTEGDVLYFGASGAPTLLAKGAAGEVLKMDSGATAPEWGAETASTLAFVSAQGTPTSTTLTTSDTDVGSVTLTLPSEKTWQWVKIVFSTQIATGESIGTFTPKISTDSMSWVNNDGDWSMPGNDNDTQVTYIAEGVPTSHTTTSITVDLYARRSSSTGDTVADRVLYAVGQYV